MKLSVFCDHILKAAEQSGKTVPEMMELVRSWGIEAVEIEMKYVLEHPEIVKILQNADLKVSCVYEFFKMEQQDETDHIRRHIDTAARLGAKRVLVVPGFLPKDEADEMARCVFDAEKLAVFFGANDHVLRIRDGLSQSAEYGRMQNVTVTVEDFDDLTSPLSSSRAVHWFLQNVPDLKATFDTGNFIMFKEDELAAFTLLKTGIAHVHCKDRSARPVAVGEGCIPIPEIVRNLKTIGYSGYLAIEHFDAERQDERIRVSAENLKKAMG